MTIELLVVARPWKLTLLTIQLGTTRSRTHMHDSTNVVSAKAQRPSGAGLAKRRW